MEETRLTIAGKEFVLKPLMLGEFTKLAEMGVDVMDMAQKGKGKASLGVPGLHKLIFVVLNKVDNAITMEWVGDNVSLTDDKEVIDTISNFINAKDLSVEPST